MAECVFAWICIIVSALTKDPMWAIASALFAVALHLSGIVGDNK